MTTGPTTTPAGAAVGAAPAPAGAPAPVPPQAAGPAVTTIDTVADLRQFNTVGWEGPDGLWRVTTRLVGKTSGTGEKEIDIDDREANLLVSIEMASGNEWEWKATKFKAVLDVNNASPNENISINDVDSGEIVLFDHARAGDPKEVFPGVAISKVVTVRTGLFSSDQLNRQSASPGTKNYRIKLTYDLEPVVGSTEQQVDTKLIFYIASD